MNFNLLLKELDKLNLDTTHYVIVGSGPLGVRDIRQSQDLDIMFSSLIWNEYSQKYQVITNGNCQHIDIGNISLLGPGSMFDDQDIASFPQMIQTADIILGYNFLNLNLLIKFKAKKAREKDLADIKLIEDYLKKSII